MAVEDHSKPPPGLDVHAVWLVFGAVEGENPVCERSCRYIGHQFINICTPETPEFLGELAAPREKPK
jgi:hypothetical protein